MSIKERAACIRDSFSVAVHKASESLRRILHISREATVELGRRIRHLNPISLAIASVMTVLITFLIPPVAIAIAVYLVVRNIVNVLSRKQWHALPIVIISTLTGMGVVFAASAVAEATIPFSLWLCYDFVESVRQKTEESEIVEAEVV